MRHVESPTGGYGLYDRGLDSPKGERLEKKLFTYSVRLSHC